ncbi:DUF4037 domain-containing protein [Wukongibacter baidiensis]
MEKRIQETFNQLIEQISHMDSVKVIGISGELRPFPEPGKGDFDIFIYCDEIPSEQERHNSIKKLGDSINNVKSSVFCNDKWGLSDYCTIEGIDTWMMYFNKEDAEKDAQEILDGEHLGKVDNYYYPIGRLGMFKNLTVLYETDDFIKQLKRTLESYPETLKEKIIEYNLQALDDVEDLERAVYRKDVLFYHFALDLAIDHFLMALFALNETYFPSRKRSLQYIEKFEKKPTDCSKRLLAIIKDGAEVENIGTSYEAFRQLCEELKQY